MSNINLNQQNNVFKCTPEKSNIVNSKNLVLWKMIFRFQNRDLPQGKGKGVTAPEAIQNSANQFRRFNGGLFRAASPHIKIKMLYQKGSCRGILVAFFSGILRDAEIPIRHITQLDHYIYHHSSALFHSNIPFTPIFHSPSPPKTTTTISHSAGVSNHFFFGLSRCVGRAMIAICFVTTRRTMIQVSPAITTPNENRTSSCFSQKVENQRGDLKGKE